MNLEEILLSKISQSQMDNYYMTLPRRVPGEVIFMDKVKWWLSRARRKWGDSLKQGRTILEVGGAADYTTM